MTLQEFKAYLDALVDETGDERVKRIRAKADEVDVGLNWQMPTVWPSMPPYNPLYPDTGQFPPSIMPYTTCYNA